MLIGLSLSFCIGDIVRGKISLDEVEKLVTGTCIETEEQWERVIRRYTELYWTDRDYVVEGNQYAITTKSYEADARMAIARLRDSGRIEQPRTEEREPHNIAAGWWLNEEGERVRL